MASWALFPLPVRAFGSGSDEMTQAIDEPKQSERDAEASGEPPQGPEIPRRVLLHTHQWVLLPLLFLL